MIFPVPSVTAQSVFGRAEVPTTAKPPRNVLNALVAIVPVAVGTVMLMVPPRLRVIEPSAVVPVLAVATIADAPLLIVVPLVAKLLIPAVRLLTVSVPPPNCKLFEAKVLVAAPAPIVRPPLLTIVAPVYELAPVSVSGPVPTLVKRLLSPPLMTPLKAAGPVLLVPLVSATRIEVLSQNAKLPAP